ncbi:MAG: YeeE/YedE family protein, partial [Bacteroidota bacterium]
MKYLKFLGVGVVFGIIMAKAEIISWFRIYEMFNFDAFHMYGIIGSAVMLGVLGIQFIKRQRLNAYDGAPIEFQDKESSITRYLVGGTLFGLGWALS